MNESGETPQEDIQPKQDKPNLPTDPAKRRTLGLLARGIAVGALSLGFRSNKSAAAESIKAPETPFKQLVTDDLNALDETYKPSLEKTAAQTLPELTADTPIPEYKPRTGTARRLVLMAKNPNTQTDFTREQLEKQLEATNEFYKRQSGGKFNIESVIIEGNWHDVPELDPNNPDLRMIADKLDHYIADLIQAGKPLPNGLTLADFQSHTYFLAGYDSQKQSKVGYGESAHGYIPYGRTWLFAETIDTGVDRHEEGHKEGLKHDVGVKLDHIGDYSKLIKMEGEAPSLMGNGYDMDLAGIHKMQLGWLKAEEVQSITESGEYTLPLIQDPNAETRMFRIFHPKLKKFIYLEWNKEGANTEPRLKAYLWDQQKDSTIENLTHTLQAPPFNTPPELDDSANGIKITQIGSGPEGVKLNISLAA